jgi:hypothetical protein
MWKNGFQEPQEVYELVDISVFVKVYRLIMKKKIYVSEGVQNCVSKWSPVTNETIAVAGQRGSSGSDSRSSEE